MRTVIIGDIHGCCRALEAILTILNPDPSADRLILLGDLFDRGPDSRGVFYRVRELCDQFGDRFVLLRGNHEDYLLRDKLSFGQRLIWERVGRQATVRSFRSHHEKMEDTAGWLRDHAIPYWKAPAEETEPADPDAAGSEDRKQTAGGRPDEYQTAGGSAPNDMEAVKGTKKVRYQCVHAGIMIDPIEANDTWTLIHDHSIVLQNRYNGPLTITGHIGLDGPMWFPGRPFAEEALKTDRTSPEDSQGKGPDPVLLSYGEAAALPDRGVICIDTGCGKGGKLTAMSIENEQFILYSVPETGK